MNNKLLFQIDRKGHLGESNMKGNPYTLIRFIGSIIEQHEGIRTVIEKAVMRSSLRIKIHRMVEAEMDAEAERVQLRLKQWMQSEPGVN